MDPNPYLPAQTARPRLYKTQAANPRVVAFIFLTIAGLILAAGAIGFGIIVWNLMTSPIFTF